jgi:hypothetical protein
MRVCCLGRLVFKSMFSVGAEEVFPCVFVWVYLGKEDKSYHSSSEMRSHPLLAETRTILYII